MDCMSVDLTAELVRITARTSAVIFSASLVARAARTSPTAAAGSWRRWSESFSMLRPAPLSFFAVRLLSAVYS